MVRATWLLAAATGLRGVCALFVGVEAVLDTFLVIGLLPLLLTRVVFAGAERLAAPDPDNVLAVVLDVDLRDMGVSLRALVLVGLAAVYEAFLRDEAVFVSAVAVRMVLLLRAPLWVVAVCLPVVVRVATLRGSGLGVRVDAAATLLRVVLPVVAFVAVPLVVRVRGGIVAAPLRAEVGRAVLPWVRVFLELLSVAMIELLPR